MYVQHYLAMCLFDVTCYCQAYAVDPRIQWVREWPGQIAICVNQIYWTAEVHEAIRSGPQGVREYHDKLQSQVREFGYILFFCSRCP